MRYPWAIRFAQLAFDKPTVKNVFEVVEDGTENKSYLGVNPTYNPSSIAEMSTSL